MNVHCSIIHNGQKVEMTQVSIMNEWTKYGIPYNGIVFGRNKEWKTDRRYNIDEA